MNDTTFIYALIDPRTGEIRYVGKANNPNTRFRDHLLTSPNLNTHTANWISSLCVSGRPPVLEILDEVPDSQWQFWEREYIRIFRAIGFRLTNIAAGGEGGSGRNPGFNHSKYTKEKMRESNLGKIRGPLTRLRISLAQEGKHRGPPSTDTKKKISSALMGHAAKRGTEHPFFGKKHSEETKQKISESKKAAFAAKKG